MSFWTMTHATAKHSALSELTHSGFSQSGWFPSWPSAMGVSLLLFLTYRINNSCLRLVCLVNPNKTLDKI